MSFFANFRKQNIINLFKKKLKKNIKKNISNLIHKYNTRYNIKKIEDIESFELKSFNLRSYYHDKILGFGDILHKVHPLAGQGFNMHLIKLY